MTVDHTRDFILVSREHLATVEHSLLALEKAKSEAEVGEQVDRGLRAIHSLKGDAGFLGFAAVRSLAHAMESVLEHFRGRNEAPPCSVVETLLTARDRLAALIDDLEHSDRVDLSDVLGRLAAAEPAALGTTLELDIDLNAAQVKRVGLIEFFQGLERLGSIHEPRLSFTGSLESALPNAPVRLIARMLPSVSPAEIDRFVNPLANSASSSSTAARDQVYPIRIDLTEWSRSTAKSLVELLANLARIGRLEEPKLEWVSNDLAVSNPAGPVLLRGMIRTGMSAAELRRQLELPDAIESPPRQRSSVASSPVVRPVVPIEPAESSGAVVSTTAAMTTSEQERLSSLRINVELLDRLMTLVSELTLVRNQSLLAFSQETGGSRAIIQRLNSVTSELQDTVLRTRMQPVGNLFGKFPRMVRDLSRQLGKQVEVVTSGREVELDKTVLEQLSDPLTHLIRNSIDHGIETPEERLSNGKPAIGQISLSAIPADGQVQIEIRDDGRGIDPAAIKAKAIALRVKTEAELARMPQADILSLILLPGFSTAKSVTDVSGRGVGMDVVRTNVEQLEGSLAIESAVGVGTSMVLRVPLTLAIIPCLIVDVGPEQYAIPQRELEEIVCLHPGGKGAIEQTFDSEVFRLRDRLLPIVRFREALERVKPFNAATKAELLHVYRPADRNPELIEYIVVLRSRGKRFGLQVDAVRGTQEVVVKPMHPTMKRLGVFAGATLMGDGRVALIANVDGIVEHAGCFGVETRVAATAAPVDKQTEYHRVLIFECGPREQFALPLVQVRRIELIDMSRVELVGNQEFVTLDGTTTRIVRLDQILNVSACPAQQVMYLVLPKFVPEPIGILISRIVDTDSLAIDLQQATVADPGVLGTAIVRGRLSLFLDIQFIREAVFGKADGVPILERADRTAVPRRVLLVDDTPFFREVVRRYLEGVGISVTTAVDGVDGLKKLADGQFELVVSDIEMPNLDGWGFVQTARERGCRLPFLALTSLSKAEHEARARSCGFDEFQEKLDHDRLVQTVERMLREATLQVMAGGRT